jgi:transposase
MSGLEKRKRRRFTEEFKREAVNLVLVEGYSVSAAARAVGVDNKCIREWRNKYAAEIPACGEDASVEELHSEIKRLRKQLQQADLEREILKKAAAYFAKESQ